MSCNHQVASAPQSDYLFYESIYLLFYLSADGGVSGQPTGDDGDDDMRAPARAYSLSKTTTIATTPSLSLANRHDYYCPKLPTCAGAIIQQAFDQITIFCFFFYYMDSTPGTQHSQIKDRETQKANQVISMNDSDSGRRVVPAARASAFQRPSPCSAM